MDRVPFVVPGVSEKPRSPRMMEGTNLQRLMIEDLRKEISQWQIRYDKLVDKGAISTTKLLHDKKIIQDNFYHLLEENDGVLKEIGRIREENKLIKKENEKLLKENEKLRKQREARIANKK
jgi:hypothetical protein